MIPKEILDELKVHFHAFDPYHIKPNFSALARMYGIDRHTIKKYWDQEMKQNNEKLPPSK